MLHIQINEKSFGSKKLLSNFDLRLNKGDKVGLIGRNGSGKTTIFSMILGEDKDFDGIIKLNNSDILMSTSQEHLHEGSRSTIDFITNKLPGYVELKKIIETYPGLMGEDYRLQAKFSDAISEFSSKGYYDIENEILSLFDSYQLSRTLLERPFKELSGGQKRLCDLIAIQVANPTIALFDEPTNHMDYVAKAAFIKWLKNFNGSCLIISHDRDVLAEVDKIVELKDCTGYSYPGNYEAYLNQNSVKTVGKMQGFETTEKQIKNLKQQIQYANAKARSQAGQQTGRSGKNKWVVLRQRYEKELASLNADHIKPDFWIDKHSIDTLSPKIIEKYDRYKSKNIKLNMHSSDTYGQLISIEKLSLGYDGVPLFENLNFSLRPGEKLQIVGRNGSGKTTLVKAIEQTISGQMPNTLIGKGTITAHHQIKLSVYHQEIPDLFLSMSLYEVISNILINSKIPANDKTIKNTMAGYLFDPDTDSNILVSQLSGGQKARIQLIRMLIRKPDLLILDEPTNHLDLPSIEELENSLSKFNGSVIYISHDSYFSRSLGGSRILLS